MRIYLASIFAMLVIATAALFALGSAQRSSAAAYTTDGARINAAWSIRQLMQRTPKAPVAGQTIHVSKLTGNAEDGECEVAGALAWLMVDFGDEANDKPGCK